MPLVRIKPVRSYFDLIHCDIWRAHYVKSLCDASYVLTILDDASRSVWVYLMKEKSEASQILKILVQWTKVKTIRSDNDSEFTTCPMKKFYGENGIIHGTSCVVTSLQNGRLERKH